MSTSIKGDARSFSDAFGNESKTAVSSYDLVSGFLMASVGLVGFITGLLALLFFLNMEWDKQPEPEMFIFDDLAGFENPEGIAEDFEEPGVEELAEVEEPQLADALEMVTDAVSTTRAAIEAVDGTAAQMGTGKGLGDRRTNGPGGPGNGRFNPAEHWVIQYTTASKEGYAAQLDAFGIEIGSLSKESTLIEYASKLSASKPSYRTGVRREEKRVFFKKPNNHPVTRWDKQLLTSSGAQTSNRFIFNFYPPAAFLKLNAIEKARVQADKVRSQEDVKRTLFGVRNGSGGKLEYYLIDIKYY
ncbi:hypothetical protein OAF71_00965 [bacterium]|nr:hypothetical protein [bacterium]